VWTRGPLPPARAMPSLVLAGEPEHGLVLIDGRRLSLRPLGAGDRERLAEMFARLSPRSRHERWLTPKRELTAAELTELTDIDHRHHEAFAAIDDRDQSIVGVARYVRYCDVPKIADMAVEVVDEFQTEGIGTALASRTIERARANGITRLTATTLRDNRAARGLLRRLDFRARGSHGTEIELELRLA
jgi:RimJ/RimL family protein N-acetyltransferase